MEKNFKKKNKETPHKHMVFISAIRAGESLGSEVDFMASGKTGRLSRKLQQNRSSGF